MKTVVGVIGTVLCFTFALFCFIVAANRTDAELRAMNMPSKKELAIGGILGFALMAWFISLV